MSLRKPERPDIPRIEYPDFPDIHVEDQPPRYRQTFSEKMRRNPLVPLGAMGTFLTLGAGLVAFSRRKYSASQSFMRARVFAQGITVMALMGGAFLGVTGREEEKLQHDDDDDE